MAMMFGRFEVQSEISKSDTALIYKAIDTESNQVVALKTQSLEPLGDRAQAFVETLIAEGESTRDLASQSIVLLYGAGEIEGQFCAAMEYIQGNSVATMLARKEGFSIWDLLDISRQVCAALDAAADHGVVHSSLEPAKIMVQWDGLVKILGYGISNMSLIKAEAGNGLGRLMPYCSPEQIRGEAIDQRSNLFTLGAILYEMVVGRKAFDASDPVALVNSIENEMPATPVSINSKIHLTVSGLIMKALAKDPGERYQTARELIADLEKCKDTGKKASTEARKTSAPAIKVDPAARAAAASKFVNSSSAPAAAPVRPQRASAPAAAAQPLGARAAAAGAGRSSEAEADIARIPSSEFSSFTDAPDTSAAHAITAAPVEEHDTQSGARASDDSPAGVMSAATLEEEPSVAAPKVAGDPMMSGEAAVSTGTSFSDIEELPPLKEPVFTTAAPEAPETPQPVVQQVTPKQFYPKKVEDKPKVQPREVAEKAIREIATVPPRLMLFSILGAVTVILVVAVAVFLHVRSEDDGSTAAPKPVKTASAPPVAPSPAPAATQAPTPAAPVQNIAPPVEEPQPQVTVRQIEKHPKGRRATAPVPAPIPVVTAGQALIDSTPQGAAFQVDGKTDPSWVTPFTVSNLAPGKHIVAINKSGYTNEMRSVDVASNAKASLVIHLAPINALVVVNSTPAGADIMLDGKPTGRVTPAQFAVEKGSHTVLLRKQGFLDETTTADLGPGQNFQFGPALRALGNAEEIRTVGKFKKLFGNSGESTAGMGTVSIHTTPKSAQITVNQHMLDKTSPVDVMMGPGNYVVDITLTGFKPVHKVIAVEKGGKVAIDETLERE
jgi:eukaryotic-like serine/threonine-protein kinase